MVSAECTLPHSRQGNRAQSLQRGSALEAETGAKGWGAVGMKALLKVGPRELRDVKAWVC